MILEIELSDDVAEKVIDAVCITSNYQAIVDDGTGLNVMIPNPQTKEEFTIEQIKKTLAERVRLAKSMSEDLPIL